MDEAGSGVWGSVHGKGYVWGQIWGAPLSTATYMAYIVLPRRDAALLLNYFGRIVIYVFVSSLQDDTHGQQFTLRCT